MRRPNFFLAGAPKSGTSALYAYLRSHPNIYMPDLKEPHYWCSDFPKVRRVRTLDEYLKLFSDAGPQHVCVGEASVTYLLSSVALSQIADFCPGAKVILILRNPVDMAYAFHSELLWNQSEDEPNFERAWNLQASRAQGNQIPALCREPKFLQYHWCAAYAAQVARVFACFAPEQVKIFLFDDFQRSPETIYRQTLEFLNVELDSRSHFPRVNENKASRSRLLARLATRPPRGILAVVNRTKALLDVRHLGLSDLYVRLNARNTRRAELSPSLHQRLTAEFRDDISQLEELLGRNLVEWRN